jgi:hypothetical protein
MHLDWEFHYSIAGAVAEDIFGGDDFEDSNFYCDAKNEDRFQFRLSNLVRGISIEKAYEETASLLRRQEKSN